MLREKHAQHGCRRDVQSLQRLCEPVAETLRGGPSCAAVTCTVGGGPAATARAVPRRAAAEARAALLPGWVALGSLLPQGARFGASGMCGGGSERPEAPYGLAGASCSWKPRYLLPASRASGVFSEGAVDPVAMPGL